MAKPNTLFNNVKERAEKAVNRALERLDIDEAEIETAAEEFDLTNYNAFFADCRATDRTTQRCGALWSLLKERGAAPAGEPDDTETATGTTDDEETAREPAAPVPETIEQLEAEFHAADQVYLITTTGCPDCQQAKEALKTWIDQGIVEVLNIQESDLGADIVIELGIDATPELVMEHDGERQVV